VEVIGKIVGGSLQATGRDVLLRAMISSTTAPIVEARAVSGA
jgi:hypothetical protein